jgi:hypothetical protein
VVTGRAEPRGGSRAVQVFLDRLEELVATATPHELAQLGYGLARVLDARGHRAQPLAEGMGLADMADEAIAQASPAKLAALRAAMRAIVQPAQNARRQPRSPTAAIAADPGAPDPNDPQTADRDDPPPIDAF